MTKRLYCGLLLLGLVGCKGSSEPTLPDGVRVTITSDVDLDTIVLRARNRAGAETSLSEPVIDRDIKNVPLVLLIQKTDLVKDGFLLRVAGNKNNTNIASGASVITFLDAGISDVSLRLTTDHLAKDVDGDGFLPCAGGPTCDCKESNALINPFRNENCTTTTVDDDCSGIPAKEMGCAGCTTGATMPCSPIAVSGTGAPIPGMGLCAMGHITCVDGVWGTTCEGGVLPAAEINNELDEDCDGVADDGLPCTGTSRACFRGLSGNAITTSIQNSYNFSISTCKAGTQLCTQEGRSYVWGPCAGEVLPVGAVENACDGRNEDCDATLDEDFDKDNDGFTSCGSNCVSKSGTNNLYVDCDDTKSSIRPPLPNNRCFGSGTSTASVELCASIQENVGVDDDCRCNIGTPSKSVSGTPNCSGSDADLVCNHTCSAYYKKVSDYECRKSVPPTTLAQCNGSGVCLSEIDACTNADVSGMIATPARPKCAILQTSTCAGTTAPLWEPITAGTDPLNECPDGACRGITGSDACQRANSVACETNDQCTSAHCVATNTKGKVCCDSICDGECKDCGKDGLVGQCNNVVDGNDDFCTGNSYCCNNECVNAGSTYNSACGNDDCLGNWRCNANHSAACSSVSAGASCNCSGGCGSCGKCVEDDFPAGVRCSTSCDDAGGLTCLCGNASHGSVCDTICSCYAAPTVSSLFVSYSSGNNAPNCGNSNTPCKTLGYALDTALDDLNPSCGNSILISVAAGSYTESATIKIPRGVVIEGPNVGTATLTVTPSVADAILLIDGATLFEDVIIRNIKFSGTNAALNRDAFGAIIRNTKARVELKNVSITSGNAGDGSASAGHASMAMLILNPGAPVVLDGVTLVAGNGGNGASGSNGTAGSTGGGFAGGAGGNALTAGTAGTKGDSSCTGSAGGTAGSCIGSVAGGDGGDGSCPNSGGSNGTHDDADTGFVNTTTGLWSATSIAANGAVGAQGDGGGGGGGGCSPGGSTLNNGKGGSGGAGGSGGGAGSLGYAGGPSIGLMRVNTGSRIQIKEKLNITRGTGGQGGRGGSGGAGGSGITGSPGAEGNGTGASSGGNGGAGHAGGKGGCGGAGAGGASIGRGKVGSTSDLSDCNSTVIDACIEVIDPCEGVNGCTTAGAAAASNGCTYDTSPVAGMVTLP